MNKYKAYFKNGETLKFKSDAPFEKIKKLQRTKYSCPLRGVYCGDCPAYVGDTYDHCCTEQVEKVVKLVPKKKKIKSLSELYNKWYYSPGGYDMSLDQYIYNYFTKVVLKRK